MPQRSNYIDITRSMIIADPNTFMPSLHDTGREDAPEQAPPILAYQGWNIIPTATGYKSFFGLGTTIDTDNLPSRADYLFIIQNERFQNILVALCEDGIWTLRGKPQESTGELTYEWEHEIDLSSSLEYAEWEGEEDPPEGWEPPLLRYYEWSFCTLERTLYMYRQTGGRLYSISETNEYSVQTRTPTFLNMKGQMGVFRAGTSLAFWDSAGAIAVSSINDPLDFKPSLETLAAITTYGRVLGRIVTCLSHGDGFIIYATKNIVPITFERDGQHPWRENAPISTSGIAYRKEVCSASPDTTHYVYTTNGLLEISNGQANAIGTAITDYIKETRPPIYLSFLQGRYLFLSLLDDYFFRNTDFQTETDEHTYWRSRDIWTLPVVVDGFWVPYEEGLDPLTEDDLDEDDDQLEDPDQGEDSGQQKAPDRRLRDTLRSLRPNLPCRPPWIRYQYGGMLDAFFVDTDFGECEDGNCFRTTCPGTYPAGNLQPDLTFKEFPIIDACPKAAGYSAEDLWGTNQRAVAWSESNAIEVQEAIWQLAAEKLREVASKLEGFTYECFDREPCSPALPVPEDRTAHCGTIFTLERLTPTRVISPEPGESCFTTTLLTEFAIVRWKQMVDYVYLEEECAPVVITPVEMGWPVGEYPNEGQGGSANPLHHRFAQPFYDAIDAASSFVCSSTSTNRLWTPADTIISLAQQFSEFGTEEISPGTWRTWRTGIWAFRYSYSCSSTDEEGCRTYTSWNRGFCPTQNRREVFKPRLSFYNFPTPGVSDGGRWMTSSRYWNVYAPEQDQGIDTNFFRRTLTLACPSGYSWDAATGTCVEKDPSIARKRTFYYERDGYVVDENQQLVTQTRKMVMKPTHICYSDCQTLGRTCIKLPPDFIAPCLDTNFHDFTQGLGGTLPGPDDGGTLPGTSSEPAIGGTLPGTLPRTSPEPLPASLAGGFWVEGVYIPPYQVGFAEDIDFPPVHFLLQDGSIAPVYPTFPGALVYDTQLQKWGVMRGEHKVLVDYSPLNEEGKPIIPFEVFGVDSGALLEDGSVALFTEAPEEAAITYGRIGSYRLGYTAIFEIRADFRRKSTGKITLHGSLDGRTIAPELTFEQKFTGAVGVIAHPKGSARWWTLTISGHFELVYLEFRGKPTKRR